MSERYNRSRNPKTTEAVTSREADADAPRLKNEDQKNERKLREARKKEKRCFDEVSDIAAMGSATLLR